MPGSHLNPSFPRLEVICGPMFAGKTTELIRRIEEARTHGHAVAVFKPASDGRYAAASLVTHAGASIVGTPVGAAAEIVAASGDAEVIAVDEAHFFGQSLASACATLLGLGRRVIVAGVERDHTGLPFEPFPTLLCEADEVVKLSGPCSVCGRPAVHSQRMNSASGRIVVGGAGMYEARCRVCFEPPRAG